MRYCKRCVYPANHPLGLAFDERGLCTGCLIHEEKDSLDWRERGQKLSAILDEYRDPKGLRHDCVVPVSGGRDSFFIVDLLKNKYGLNPLLITFNRHYNTRAGIFNLEQLRTRIGLDIVTLTINPDRYKKLIRYSLDKRGSIHWPYLAGSTVFPVQMAVRKKIPLIVWGAHQGVDQVGMFSHHDQVEMTRRYRKEHDLMGLEPEDALDESDLTEHDLTPLFYPDDADLHSIGIRGIYLNNYIRWDTKAQHETMLQKYDYYTGSQGRTFDTYNDIHCSVYSSLHDAIKFRKWGYGKISDHVSREIRLGRLTREDGIHLVGRYNNKPEGDAPDFAQWLGLSEQDFWEKIDRHRSPTIWEKQDAHWVLKDSVFNHKNDPGFSALRLPLKEPAMSFQENRPARIEGEPDAPRLLLRGMTGAA
jgi:N-acetyl sugar amidotransferase